MSRRPRENVHHALPKSRFPEYRSALWNLRWVDRDRHAAYHHLFVNRTPCEAAIKLLLEFGTIGNLAKDPALDDLIELLVKARY